MDSEVYVQIVHRKKPREITYIRLAPDQKKITENQMKARVLFGEIASEAHGEKFTRELPPAAVKVMEKMKNQQIGRTEKKPKWMQVLFPQQPKKDVLRALGITETLLMKESS